MPCSREPQNIDKHNWYYEYRSHLLLIHEVRDADGNYCRTDSIKIPWRSIERSRDRRPKTRKRLPLTEQEWCAA